MFKNNNTVNLICQLLPTAPTSGYKSLVNYNIYLMSQHMSGLLTVKNSPSYDLSSCDMPEAGYGSMCD